MNLLSQYQERNVYLMVDDDRDYFSGRLQLRWWLPQQWFLEASVRHTQQEFDSPEILGGATSEDRSKIFLNLRYLGLNEVRIRPDRRILRKGY